jgi:hypothetical protein
MVQLPGNNAVPSGVSRKEDNISSSQAASEELVGGRAERGFDAHPFLPGESFDLVQSTTSDNADSMFRHKPTDCLRQAGL